MGKIINFKDHTIKKTQDASKAFNRSEYRVSPNCKNPDSYGIICIKCGQCGRKFKNGVLS